MITGCGASSFGRRTAAIGAVGVVGLPLRRQDRASRFGKKERQLPRMPLESLRSDFEELRGRGIQVNDAAVAVGDDGG